MSDTMTTEPAPYWSEEHPTTEFVSPDWAQCQACGVVVRGPFTSDEVVEVFITNKHSRDVARCPACAKIQARADELMRANPSERARIGSLSIAVHRLECALDALDAVNTPPKVIDLLTRTGPDLRRLMQYLMIPGGTARWAVQVMTTRARQTQQMDRWGHLTPEKRQELRDAVSELFHSRVELPQPIPCPSGGCMLCGVGAVMAKSGEAVWVEMSADSATIGGPMTADTIDGHVCLVCDAAIDSAAGVGQTAMGMSVREFLGVPRGLRYYEEVGGLVGWAARRGARPNAKPWDHIDLSAVVAELRSHGVAVSA